MPSHLVELELARGAGSTVPAASNLSHLSQKKLRASMRASKLPANERRLALRRDVGQGYLATSSHGLSFKDKEEAIRYLSDVLER